MPRQRSRSAGEDGAQRHRAIEGNNYRHIEATMFLYSFCLPVYSNTYLCMYLFVYYICVFIQIFIYLFTFIDACTQLFIYFKYFLFS